jgi:hypothetical protein
MQFFFGIILALLKENSSVSGAGRHRDGHNIFPHSNVASGSEMCYII